MNSLNFNNVDYIIYTDGACIGNPGRGGWAALIISESQKKSLVGSEKLTTNNRMELMAVIMALKSIENMRCIILFSDSKYVIDGITKWIEKWKINNWKSSNKKPVKNVDLWKELDELTKKLTIDWKWVKAHSTDIYNNEVDKLARKEAEKII